MVRVAAVVASLSLFGCAAWKEERERWARQEQWEREHPPRDAREVRMEEMLQPWVGRDIHKAIERFGPPTRRYENGPTVLYVWHYTGASNAAAIWAPGVGVSSSWTPSCDIQLAADSDDVVVSWRWQGRC